MVLNELRDCVFGDGRGIIMYTLLKPPLSADISASLPMIFLFLLPLLVHFIPVGFGAHFMKRFARRGKKRHAADVRERGDGCDQEIQERVCTK